MNTRLRKLSRMVEDSKSDTFREFLSDISYCSKKLSTIEDELANAIEDGNVSKVGYTIVRLVQAVSHELHDISARKLSQLNRIRGV